MSYNKICIFRTGALGDVILTLPVIENLHLANPNARIHLIGNPRILSLAEAPYIQIADIDRAVWAPLFAPNPTNSSELQNYFENVDLVLSYLPDPEQTFKKNLQQLGVPQILTCPPRPTQQIHATDHLLQPLHELGISTPFTIPQITISENDVAPIPTEIPPNTILIHPGSGGKHKCWPLSHFADLADQIIQKTKCTVAISSGPADHDLAEQIAHKMTQKAIFLSPLTLRQYAATMTLCQAYIGNDSGPTHLAGAIGLPTIALFGPTDPKIWAPRGPSVAIIQSNTQSIDDIQSNLVFQAFQEISDTKQNLA